MIQNFLSPSLIMTLNLPPTPSHTLPHTPFTLYPLYMYNPYLHSSHINHVDKQPAVTADCPSPPSRVPPPSHPLPPTQTKHFNSHTIYASSSTPRMRKHNCTIHRTIPHTSFSLEYATHYNLSSDSDHFYSDILFAYISHLSYLSPILNFFLNPYNSQITSITFNKLSDFLIPKQILYLTLLTIDLISYNTYIHQLTPYLHHILLFNPKYKFLHNTHTHLFPSYIYLLLSPIPKRRFLIKTPHNKELLEIITITFRLALTQFALTSKMSNMNKNCDMVFEDSVEQQKTYVNPIFVIDNYVQSLTYIALLRFSLTYKFKIWSGLLLYLTFKQILIASPRKIKFPQA